MQFGNAIQFDSMPGSPPQARVITRQGIQGPPNNTVALELYGDASVPIRWQNNDASTFIVLVDAARLLPQWRPFFDNSVDAQLASRGVQFKELWVKCSVPPGAVLIDKPYAIKATASTEIVITLKQSGLDVSIQPPLEIVTPWYLDNMVIAGLSYTFGGPGVKGEMKEIRLQDKWGKYVGMLPVWVGKNSVKDLVANWTKGTPFDAVGFNPLTSSDLEDALKAVARNVRAQSSAGGSLNQSALGNLGAGLNLTMTTEVKFGDTFGAVVIPAQGSLSVSAAFSGSANDLANKPAIERLSFGGDLFLVKDNERIAQLTSVIIQRGGKVDVQSFTALGSLRAKEEAEVGLKGLGIIALLAAVGGVTSDQASRIPAPEATIVQAVAKRQMDEALTKAVREALRQNAAKIRGALPSGTSMEDFFGLSSDGAPLKP